MTCSRRRNAPAHAHRGLSIRPMAGLPPADAGGAEDRGRRTRISPRPAAGDRDLQEQRGAMQRRQIRSNAVAAIRGACSALQHRDHQSLRRSGGCLIGGALPDGRAAGDRHARRDRRSHQLPAHRADARRHHDVLRRGAGPGLAAQHRHERKSASARQHPPVVRRLARPLGGQHARDRRDEFQSEDRFSGLARESASGRALDAHRPDHARLCGDGRRPDGVDAAVDRQAGIHPAEQRGKPDLSPSRAASKETMACRACCSDTARKNRHFAKGQGADPRTISTVSANDSSPDPLQ